MRNVRLPWLALAALLSLSPREARAVEVGNVAGETVSVDVTNTSVLAYHFDNRNVTFFKPQTVADDYYGEWINRFNLQLNWWRLRIAVRVDAATYIEDPDPDDAPDLVRRSFEEADAAKITTTRPDRNDYANRFRRELHSRFLNTYYPAKLSIGYTQPGVDVTVGDFYAQLGRGLVLSLRKIDELSIDTTVRGGKVVLEHDFGPTRAAVTMLGGQLNPLRVDETSGRRLHGTDTPLFFAYPETGDLVTFEFDQAGAVVPIREKGRPSYLEDTVWGGRIEAGSKDVLLGLNGSLLTRQSFTREYLECFQRAGASVQAKSDCGAEFPEFTSGNASQMHNLIRTYGWSVNVPSIAKRGDLYLEVARQEMRDGHITALSTSGQETRTENLDGWAAYASASARGGPVTFTLEAKHYRSFFPLASNIDSTTPGFGAPEFGVVSYSQPPTAEPIYVEQIGAPNVCMTGGRGRTDYRFTPSASVYGWLGYYASLSESQPNDRCRPDPNPAAVASERDVESSQTKTWDTALGTELDFEKKKTHVRAWVGARLTDRDEPYDGNVAGRTAVFYREGYVRYDVIKSLVGPFSLQAQGFHRRRYEPITLRDPWWEGENYTALQWTPHMSAIFGYEYLTSEGCEPGNSDKTICHYFSGGAQWKSGGGDTALERVFDTVSVFVGQRRSAVRCVSGVCRRFPAFEGARLEVVSRF